MMAVILCRCLLPRSPTIDYGMNNDRETRKPIHKNQEE